MSRADVIQLRARLVLSDAMSELRAERANTTFDGVTLAHLIEDHITSLGDPDDSGTVEVDPYGYTPGAEEPAGQKTTEAVNFVSGVVPGGLTRLERIAALESAVQDLVVRLSEVEDAVF